MHRQSGRALAAHGNENQGKHSVVIGASEGDISSLSVWCSPTYDLPRTVRAVCDNHRTYVQLFIAVWMFPGAVGTAPAEDDWCIGGD